jgi:nucleoside-diphosphate-sugar epimerase
MAKNRSLASSCEFAARSVGKKFLITGASGFIGSHLTCRLAELGAIVHAVSKKTHRDRVDGVQWWQGDLSDQTTAMNIVSSVKPDIMIHLAASVTVQRELEIVLPTLRHNLVSSVNLLTAAVKADCGRVVLLGSLEEPDPEEWEPTPCSPYAASKWSASAYGRMFFQLYGMPVVIARLFMTYGPAQLDLTKLVPYVTLSLLRGESPRLSNGSRPIDWIFIADVVDGLLALSQTDGIVGKTIDIGSGTLVTIRDVVQQLVDLIGPPTEPLFGALADRPYERIRVADIADAEAKSGWKAKVSLSEGLARTVAWYRQQLQTGCLGAE